MRALVASLSDLCGYSGLVLATEVGIKDKIPTKQAGKVASFVHRFQIQPLSLTIGNRFVERTARLR